MTTATTAPSQGVAQSVRQALKRNSSLINIVGLLVAIVALYIYLMVSASGFATAANQLGLLREAALIGIAATGMTLVIIAGEIDVSVGPAVALSSVIVASAMTTWGLPSAVAILITLALGLLWGSLAGLLRARFLVPSFIATLGLWGILRGFAHFSTNALPVSFPVDDPIMDLLAGTILGV